MTHLRTKTLMTIPLFFAGLMLPMASAQPGSEPVKAVQLTGLVGVKDNAKGTLSVEKVGLHFAYAKGKSDVSAASIEDVTTGADSQAALGKTVTTVSMAAPYGGGRFLALFRTKIDTLTIEYRDTDGGLHGVIFTMPAGTAETIKKDLVAQGAHTRAQQTPDASPAPSVTSVGKEQN